MSIDETFLKNLPTGPGVYIMEDRQGKVIYVGKAANIRNRVRNYFSKGGDERLKVRLLVQRIANIKTILTETEKEALLLENNLIKEHRPKYNVNLRDDKSFFSLRLNVSHTYPRLTLIRTQKIKINGAKYFGPYSSARDARITLNLIRRIFPLRQCSDRQIARVKRPCLNCQMNRCLCPCAGTVDPKEYRRMVENVSLLLEGRNEELIKTLKREMLDASENLRFEEAARIRDRLYAVDRTLQKQNVSFFHFKDQDVVAVLEDPPDTYVVEILSFRRGNLLAEESYIVKNSTLEPNEILTSAIKQFYHNAVLIPAEVLVPMSLERQEVIESWLSDMRGAKVNIRVALRGPGALLIRLALKNAEMALERGKQKSLADNALDELSVKLKIDSSLKLIECYDISNISGVEPVGVKVAFLDGVPFKSLYRKFKIRNFENQDDPGMLNQVISRRIKHLAEDPLGDLLIIDGGKSQLNAAVAALQEVDPDHRPPVISIAKAQSQDDTDRIYAPNRKNPLSFSKGDACLLTIMRIRDEAHRYALSFHTGRRAKTVIRSNLDNIAGIGPKKRNVLLKTLGSLKGVLEATDDQLLGLSSITSKDIQRIRECFKDFDFTES
ncbi:MAG: excinuclease ABC subunit UvrC [Deltaproteobacteria bacterium]|nr:excinuclease ABC subunit UvrC [Deltaproteobacteria bacterium]